MIGFNFSEHKLEQNGQDPFEKLLDLFKELLLHTSGDVKEALSWLTQLDKQYKLTDPDYGVGDFIRLLYNRLPCTWIRRLVIWNC